MQWDTSEHAWLEERGPKLYLISMIDDATSRLHARFVLHDSTEENMRLLWSYLESYGRPLSFYTDKASLFQTAPKTPRNLKELPRDEREPLPPTQIGRALAEVGIVWIGAHSPQAKGRVERSFQTAQDRLVKGLRVAEAKTLAQANAYLEAEFLPWWNQTLTVVPATAADAHRPLDKGHSLPASLSYVETREVGNGYTIQFDHKLYRIAPTDIRAGLRGASCADRNPAGRLHGRSLPRSLPCSQRVYGAPQSNGADQESPKTRRRFTAEESVDEKLLSDPARQSGSFRDPSRNHPRRKTHSVGRAKATRPSSRFLYSKPPLGSFTKVSSLQKAKPSDRTPLGPADRGLATVYFGANSVASALNLPQERDPLKNPSHFKPNPSTLPSKQDISTLRGIGHFYFALTRSMLLVSANPVPLDHVGCNHSFSH